MPDHRAGSYVLLVASFPVAPVSFSAGYIVQSPFSFRSVTPRPTLCFLSNRVAHVLEELDTADTIIVTEGGRITDKGPKSSLPEIHEMAEGKASVV